VGKLAEVIGPYDEGTGPSSSPISVNYRYDSQGRLRDTITEIDNEFFWESRTYDVVGRLETLTYPATDGTATASSSGGGRHVVAYEYNVNGYLNKVRKQGGGAYWQASDADAYGNVTNYQLGGGTSMQGMRIFERASGYQVSSTVGSTNFIDLEYGWGSRGNLSSRKDKVSGATVLEETFAYDSLDRLKTTTVTAPLMGGTPVTVSYDTEYSKTGRIENKYSSNGGDYLSYQYSKVNAGPHAVTVVTAGGTARTYAYDDVGNLELGAGRTINWTEFNKPSIVFDGAGNRSEFRYGPERQRFSHVKTDVTATEETTTVYVGGAFEKITKDTTALVEFRHYIMVAGQAVAIHTEWDTTSTRRDEYLHRDHLGSIVAITSDSGQVIERFSYGPWGKRRNPSGWAASAPGTHLQPTSLDNLSRGFTGHEQLDHLGLIHMNGRIYDPELGRFLSADFIVQGFYPFITDAFEKADNGRGGASCQKEETTHPSLNVKPSPWRTSRVSPRPRSAANWISIRT